MEKILDMTTGKIPSMLLRFAWPVFLSSLFQQMYIVIDTLIVSRFLGDGALAALSNCENIAWLITSFMFGIGMGASVLIGQAFGARNWERLQILEGNAYAMCWIVSFVFIGLAPLICKPILIWMQTPQDVFDQSYSYLSLYIAGAGGILLFNMGSAIYQAIGDAKTPLYYLILSSFINIALDLTFILVFHTDVWGAALATVIAEWLTGIGLMLQLLNSKAKWRLERSKVRLQKEVIDDILKIGFPGAIESSAVSFANTIVQGFINTFGSIVMAATGAFASIEGFSFLPITAFCQAVGTFTAQNVGAMQKKRTMEGCRFGLFMMGISSFVLGMLLLWNSESLMQIFSSDPQTISYGLLRAKITLWFYPLCGLTHCLAAIFRGAGKPMISMLGYVLNWGLLRVIILLFVLPHYHVYSFLCWVYPITWLGSSLFLSWNYMKLDWFPEKKEIYLELD
ncbi:MATE family efflux transporter [Dubosiella newyorkensis]|jgi:putative MATE family efflux protein|uniref:MATE family efflux transporter n=3 Tax=Dubosiella newyorkensis TaxID=1862672 RepID=UPI0023531FE9|nr:MATE family efflux transporter [Dubosiella newyorkensis]MCI9041969.1 MATE family efflux transporter [Dubosiella newyorkensis]